MRNLTFITLLLAGCATTEAEAPKEPPHPLVKPHQLAQCVKKGSVIAWGNQTELTEYDLQSYNTAADRCGTLFKDQPCLRLFLVLGNKQYKALCGFADDAIVPEQAPPAGQEPI